MSSLLSGSVLKALRQLLNLAHELEKSWPAEAPRLPELLKLIEQLSTQPSQDLSRLSQQARHLTPEMTAKHFATILVPFERLLGRALRDDEFMVAENDSTELARETAPMIVIADNIRSAFNVGAIFRTSECFGVEEVFLSGYTPTPEEEKTARTSMGTQEHLPWRQFSRGNEAVREAKSKGYKLVALETVEGALDLGEFEWPEKTALILGNERFGIDRELLALADHIVRIPLHGHKNSLNVGVAFGITAADWRTKRDALRPIATFHAPEIHPYDVPRQGAVNTVSEEGYIEFAKGQMFEQALEDLAGFDRIWILYRFHHNSNWKPKVLPPRGPRTKRGVFATRSPYRPNPLGLSCVELVRIEGLRVYVRGYDLLDQTPIYDIKPYLPYADAFPDASAGWTEGLDNLSFNVEVSDKAERQVAWLEGRGVAALRGFLQSQLTHDPLDDERKRVQISTEPGRPHTLAYRTWRADFEIEGRAVRVLSIRSGFSSAELQDAHDPYGDKDIHRDFLKSSLS